MKNLKFIHKISKISNQSLQIRHLSSTTILKKSDRFQQEDEAWKSLRSSFPNVKFDDVEPHGAPTFDPMTGEPLDLKKFKKQEEEKKEVPFYKSNASGPNQGIPIWLGLFVIGGIGWYHVKKRVQEQRLKELEIVQDGHVLAVEGPWTIKAYSVLPLRIVSRLWGKFCNLTLPVWLREPVLGAYAKTFGVNLSEAERENLQDYTSLTDVFLRRLKNDSRPVDTKADVVSPCDGTILSFGLVTDRRIEQVKGWTYSLDHFIGEKHRPLHRSDSDEFVDLLDKEAIKGLVKSSKAEEVVEERFFGEINGLMYSLSDLLGPGESNVDEVSSRESPESRALHPHHKLPGSDRLPQKDSRLWFAVIYLSPGDYHRFHSPTDWIIEKRRHFAGDLFSVSPYIVSKLKNLFVLNERVAILGRWRHGWMSMTAVGATNVGNIELTFDQDMITNQGVVKSVRRGEYHPPGTYVEKGFDLGPFQGLPTSRGVELGAFRLGSTIVLVFEAPRSFEFAIKNGSKIKMGEAVGRVK